MTNHRICKVGTDSITAANKPKQALSFYCCWRTPVWSPILL